MGLRGRVDRYFWEIETCLAVINLASTDVKYDFDCNSDPPLYLLPRDQCFSGRRNNIFSMEYVTGCLTRNRWKVISGIIALLWLGEKGKHRVVGFQFGTPSSLFLQLRDVFVGKCVSRTQTIRRNFFPQRYNTPWISILTFSCKWIFFELLIYILYKKKRVSRLTRNNVSLFVSLKISSLVKIPALLLVHDTWTMTTRTTQPDYSLLLYRHSHPYQPPLSLSHRLTVLLLKITSSLPTREPSISTCISMYHFPWGGTCMILINNRILRGF